MKPTFALGHHVLEGIWKAGHPPFGIPYIFIIFDIESLDWKWRRGRFASIGRTCHFGGRRTKACIRKRIVNVIVVIVMVDLIDLKFLAGSILGLGPDILFSSLLFLVLGANIKPEFS
jgi:hypothetical protein